MARVGILRRKLIFKRKIIFRLKLPKAPKEFIRRYKREMRRLFMDVAVFPSLLLIFALDFVGKSYPISTMTVVWMVALFLGATLSFVYSLRNEVWKDMAEHHNKLLAEHKERQARKQAEEEGDDRDGGDKGDGEGERGEADKEGDDK